MIKRNRYQHVAGSIWVCVRTEDQNDLQPSAGNPSSSGAVDNASQVNRLQECIFKAVKRHLSSIFELWYEKHVLILTRRWLYSVGR